MYPSRWNCVLDLASSSVSKQNRQSAQIEIEDDEAQEYFVIMLTPASLFLTARQSTTAHTAQLEPDADRPDAE